MGLNVTTDIRVFDGKKLIDYNFNSGNEYIVILEDKEGNTERVRIPASLKEAFDTYAYME